MLDPLVYCKLSAGHSGYFEASYTIGWTVCSEVKYLGDHLLGSDLPLDMGRKLFRDKTLNMSPQAEIYIAVMQGEESFKSETAILFAMGRSRD